MERKFLREFVQLEKYDTLEKIKVGVIGLTSGVGTTTVATWIAKTLSENGKSVAYVEFGNPYKGKSLLFESVAMDQRFSNRKFCDYYSEIISGGKIKQFKNIEEGINWALITPDNCAEEVALSQLQLVKLLENIAGEVVVADINNDVDLKLLDVLDVIVVVADPLPSKLLSSRNKLQELKKYELRNKNIIWVVNKMNEGVNKKEVKNYFKEKNINYIKEVPLSELYYSEYQCKFSFTNKKLKEILNSDLLEISKEIDNITKCSQ